MPPFLRQVQDQFLYFIITIIASHDAVIIIGKNLIFINES